MIYHDLAARALVLHDFAISNYVGGMEGGEVIWLIATYLCMQQPQLVASVSVIATGPGSVFYTTYDETARAGIDYSPKNGVLVFTAAGTQTISIPIVAKPFTGSTKFGVMLKDFKGVTAGYNLVTEVCIVGNVRGPVL